MASHHASSTFRPGNRVRPALLQLVLISAALSGGGALAAAPYGVPQLPPQSPSDPFQTTAPAAEPTPLAPGPNPVSGAQAKAASAASPTGSGLGVPRFSSTGGTTRVVFDLPTGVQYTLTPTFSGLRLDLQGPGSAALRAQHLPSPGAAVSDFTLTPDGNGTAQVLLQTPFPLGGQQGWTAAETTIATGGRVLILTLGAILVGGAASSVTGSVQAVAAPAAPGSPQTGVSDANTGVAGPPAPGTAPLADQLPPGDTASLVPGGALPTALPALPGSTDSGRQTTGMVSGSSVGVPALSAPRIGKNSGLTRVVLDLPPGTSYRITPLPLGLRIDLTGVSASDLSAAVLGKTSLTPELRSWRYAANLTGASLTLLTAAPITLRSGWRGVLLPPASGSALSRLAIDVSPALADTSPLGAVALAPLKSSRSPILAFSGSPNRPKVVLDPGHGGSDPGSIGQVVEKQVTLEVARRVRADLAGAGIDVIMTRDSDTALAASKNTDLAMRAALGSGVAQLFVSIHVNSMEANAALRGYGIETWWNPNHPNSQALAQSLQQNTIASTAAYSQGLKNRQSLAVLRQSRIPAALVEIGYTSHPVDGLNLKDNNYLDRVAYGVASGIRDALQAGLGANWR